MFDHVSPPRQRIHTFIVAISAPFGICEPIALAQEAKRPLTSDASRGGLFELMGQLVEHARRCNGVYVLLGRQNRIFRNPQKIWRPTGLYCAAFAFRAQFPGPDAPFSK